ncbi:MAG: uracil-DNA glycosylase [Lachnospiraceae bacterium]|nr:uracil-DNA glycosylase [Lachnospiraceae bacterium]
MAAQLGNDWQELLAEEFEKDYYKELRAFLTREYKSNVVYPDMYHIFATLQTTAYRDVKVVILGQDPYHNPGQAHGFSFSVREGIEIPPSLVNIYKELRTDLGCAMPHTGCLNSWAEQGVLLLNSVLTVRAGEAGSHRGQGWEIFTDRIITLLNEREKPVVFLLWGRYAKDKRSLITDPRHLVLTAAHPSPLSAYNGFFGCRHFSQTNAFLERTGQTPIDWQIRP